MHTVTELLTNLESCRAAVARGLVEAPEGTQLRRDLASIELDLTKAKTRLIDVQRREELP